MTPSRWRAVLALVFVLACPRAKAASRDFLGLADRQETFGAVLAPAVLPDGANAFYGFAGVPEVGAGYRQGFSRFELEGRARLDYLRLSLAVEGLGRYPVLSEGPLELAPYAGLGLVGNTGSQHFELENSSFIGLRALGGAVLTYRLMETLRLVGVVDLTFDLPLGVRGLRFLPLAGGGAELYLGKDITLLALGELGVDVLRPPIGATVTRLGYAFRIGVGFRVF
ncbi:MAG TPA: hypothetical protein VK447_18305 [Myxococcaceae bacterium]|nr:hypothetical protein [Myxococcaceae bacterium]